MNEAQGTKLCLLGFTFLLRRKFAHLLPLPANIVHICVVFSSVTFKVSSAFNIIVIKIYRLCIPEDFTNIHGILWSARQPHNNHFVIARNA